MVPLISMNQCMKKINAEIDCQQSTGVVNLGCFVPLRSFLMPDLINGFIEQYCHIYIELIEGEQQKILDGLKKGKLDMALIYSNNKDGYDLHPLFNTSPYVLLAQDHPLVKQGSVSLIELENEPMILLDAAPSRDYFSNLFINHGLKPRISHYCPSFEMVRGLVANGLGYSLLVTKPADNLSYCGKPLVSLPIRVETKASKIVLAVNSDKSISQSSRLFLRYCIETYGNIK